MSPRRPMMPLLTLRKPSRRPSQWKRACCGDLTAFSPSSQVRPEVIPGGWGRQQWDVRGRAGLPQMPHPTHSRRTLAGAPRPHQPRPGPPAAAGGLPEGAAGGRGACVPQPGAHWLPRATSCGLGAYAATWQVPALRMGEGWWGRAHKRGDLEARRVCGRHLTPLPFTLGPHQPGDPAHPARAPARPLRQPCHPHPGGPEPMLPAAVQHPGHAGPALLHSGPGGPGCAATAPLRWAGQLEGHAVLPLGSQRAAELKPSPVPVSGTGWWLVVNKDQQMAWFPAPYLEAAAPHQGQGGGQSLGISGENDPPSHPAFTRERPA